MNIIKKTILKLLLTKSENERLLGVQEKKDLPKLKLIFEDKKGKKWYTFYDVLELPVSRSIHCEHAIGVAEYGISANRLDWYFGVIKDSLKVGDVETIVYATAEMKSYSKQIAEYETLLQLAAAFVVEEGEDLNDLTTQTANKKIELWEKDSEALNFFLSFAFSNTRQFGKHSDLSIVNYLNQVKKIPGQRNLRPHQK